MNRMQDSSGAVPARRRFFVSGEPFEVWENPEVGFDSDQARVDGYARRGRWDLVFNALVLRGCGFSTP